MFWPTPQDYREAIQNPHICFQDPELQSGLPELDKLGLPRPISGSFASVYRIKCGLSEWAIRCFTNNVKDQKDRYDAISSHLSSVNLPYMVPFEYLSEGIKINGNWFPVVKMQWVEGESLLYYIQRNLHNVEILKGLANQWLKIINELHMANIAHGDLQHGNILIHRDEIILIDYDGMYVPGLNGMLSNELGHRNYQHPGRVVEHFGPYIDNFSVWVILIAILAVSVDASLWNSLGAGEAEESLLFRQKDFVSPGESRAFELLELVNDETLRSLVNCFRDVMALEVPNVPKPPDPESQVNVVHHPAASVSSVSADLATKLNTYLTAFYDKFTIKKRLAVAQSQPETLDPVDSSWVLDYLTAEARPFRPLPTYGLVLERTVSFSVITLTALATTVMYGKAPITGLASCTALGLVIEIAFLSWRYVKLPTVMEKRTTSEKIKELYGAASDLTSELNKINYIKQELQQMEENKINDLLQRQREISERVKNETEEVEKELWSQISEIAGERQTIDQEEHTELAGLLASFRKTWLEDQLKKHTISKEKIPDIDDEIKRRLRSNGIRTPADFLDINIFQSYGRKKIEKVYMILKNGGSVHIELSPSQAKALVEWKKMIERKYRPNIPQSMPPGEITALKSKFNERKSILNNVEQTYKTRAQDLISTIKQTYSPEHDLLKREEDAARIILNNELNQFDKEIFEINKHLLGEKWELNHLSKKMDSFKDINFLKFLRKVFLFI
ncbi:protein kinase domain-containing protein [Paenibacillus sp. LjRoot56]|uniref:protein kinase domain-containing protein n=1 Tax=Paenibacillus sp. LjRoot56 TaxID=3342333 RepID=UPI003ECF6323